MKNSHFNNESLDNDLNTRPSTSQFSNPNMFECPIDFSNTNIDLSDSESNSTDNDIGLTDTEDNSTDALTKLKDSALKFVLSLFSKNNMNRKDAFQIIDSVKQYILAEISNIVKSMILPFIDVTNQITLLDLLFNISNLFKDYDSEFKLIRTLQSLNLMTPVDEVVFSSEIQPLHNQGEICLSDSIKKGIIFPIDFYIEEFFKIDNLIESSLNHLDQLLNENKLDNFVQGSIWQNKLKKFPDDQKIIPYFLYNDDLQINSSLGSHTSSVCAFYIAFPTVPNCYKIDNIIIAALIDSSDLKQFGNYICLHKLVDKLINLEVNGINFNVNGENVNVKFVLGLILGDNLALNSLLECNKSFNAHSYCRLCQIKKDEAEHQCLEIAEKLRTKENYDIDISKQDAQSTGLKCETIFNKIPSFHFTENQVVDIMHDLFEGVFIYDICKSILLLFELEKSKNVDDYHKFSLTTLNLRKANFNYGTLEIGNRSEEISLHRLKTNNLNMSARECWTFIHFFPLMFHDLVDNNSDVWKFICIVVQLLDLVLYVSHNSSTINLLKNTIYEHNKLYIELFEDTLKPKHHFLTHYPSIIKSSGPLRHFSNFMFEAKHKELKTYANATNSRICFILSASFKFQFKFANKIFFNKSSCKQVIYKDKNKIWTKFNETILTFVDFRNLDFITLSSISFNGTIYKSGYHVAKLNSENKIEAFEIKEIIYLISDSKVFLIYEKQFELKFEPNLVAYSVKPFEIFTIAIEPINDLIGFPFNIITLHNGKKSVRIIPFTSA